MGSLVGLLCDIFLGSSKLHFRQRLEKNVNPNGLEHAGHFQRKLKMNPIKCAPRHPRSPSAISIKKAASCNSVVGFFHPVIGYVNPQNSASAKTDNQKMNRSRLNDATLDLISFIRPF